MVKHIKYIENEIDNFYHFDSKQLLTESLFIVQAILEFCHKTQILNYDEIVNLNNKAYKEYHKNISRLEKGI